MKIFGSTQYVNKEERANPWYQIEVINQWDWKTKSICYQYMEGTLILFCLKLNISTSGNSWKSEIIEKLTDEMKQELVAMGYSIKRN